MARSESGSVEFRPGPRSHRPIRAHVEQHHLRGLRRVDALLGLLSQRRRRLRLRSGVGLRDSERVPPRRRAGWSAPVRLLPDGRRGRSRAGRGVGPRVRRRRCASARVGEGLQPLPVLRRRFDVSKRARIVDRPAPPALCDIVPDRRRPRRERLLRRAQHPRLERFEQDRLRSRLLPRRAPRSARQAIDGRA